MTYLEVSEPFTALLDDLLTALVALTHALSEAFILPFGFGASVGLAIVRMTNDASTTDAEWKRLVPILLAHIVLVVVDVVPTSYYQSVRCLKIEILGNIPLCEVVFQILNDWALQRNADIRPAHSRIEFAIELVVLPLFYIIEIHDSSIVIVLARENDSVEVSRVRVCDAVLVCVPSAIAQVKPAHESNVAVHQT